METRARPAAPGDAAGTVLSVPIRVNGTDLGELVLSGKGGGGFTGEDGELAAALAAAAGAAAWNARLHEESQRRQGWLEATLGVTADLVQVRDLIAGREFDLVAERALEASQSLLAVIAVPDGGSFRIAAAAGTVPSRGLLAVLAGRLRQPAGHAQDGEASQWLGEDAARGLGPVLVVRLGVATPPGSLLVLARKEGRSYARSDVSAAALFGANAGVALRLRALALDEGGDAVAADRRRVSRGLGGRVLPRLVAAGLSLRRLWVVAPAPRAGSIIEEIADQLGTAVRELREAASVLGSAEGLQEHRGFAFSGALLEAAGALDGKRDFESEITIAGRTESIPTEAGDVLLAAAAEVFSVLRGVHAGAALALTVTVGEHEAELVVRDGALQGRDPGDSPPAEALVRAASRVPGAGLISTGSGALLRCRVPFAGRASSG